MKCTIFFNHGQAVTTVWIGSPTPDVVVSGVVGIWTFWIYPGVAESEGAAKMAWRNTL